MCTVSNLRKLRKYKILTLKYAQLQWTPWYQIIFTSSINLEIPNLFTDNKKKKIICSCPKWKCMFTVLTMSTYTL